MLREKQRSLTSNFFYNKASLLELVGKMPEQRSVPLPFPVAEFLGGVSLHLRQISTVAE